MNGILSKPEFRRELVSQLRASVDGVGGFHALERLARAEGVIIANNKSATALKAVAADPNIEKYDWILLRMGAFFYRLEIEECVKILNFEAEP